MDRISAAGNLTIEHDIDHWRLISSINGQERTLIEAEKGQPVHYIEIFGSKRRLPKGGNLSLDDIQRVVLGWSPEDESWHLGLLLEPELSEQRGSRWVELARWPDAETTVFGEIAADAGRSLGRTLVRPFNLIEPDKSTASKPVLAPPPPLRSLPLEFDQWSMVRNSALQLVRSSQWMRQRVVRLMWYGLLVVAYFVLSIVTLQGGIALPNPEFLPYLGIAVGVLLLGMMLYTLYEIINKPNRIVVTNEGVAWMRGNRQGTLIQTEQIDSIFVSEVVQIKGKKQNVFHGELNLRLMDGSFKTILQQPHQVEEELPSAPETLVEEVVPLTLYNAYTDLQMAGLHMAQTLGVECQYDCRTK
ncbi:MAG: hypothetical protein LCI00_20080 [Chloroflexi bacterium]|nr:hypothetical protein [Chloroflexota bacterium]MCC6893782.1 hypothetical protein [Anaerolineae bacterium]